MRVACLWFEDAVPASKVAELFLRFSPQICVREDRAIFVEIGKCRNLYSEKSFIARTNILLKKYQLQARIRIGADITDSLAYAKSGLHTFSQLTLDSLIDFVDPFARDESLQKCVSKIKSTFQDLGISTLDQLKKIPLPELVSRFGIVGRFCHQRIHMQDFVAWPKWEPEEVISELKQFPYLEFYGELEPILFELKSQLDQVFARLFARQKRAIKMKIIIQCEKFSTNPEPQRIFNFDFFAPQGNTKATLRIVKERLFREFQKKPILSPVESIETVITKSLPYDHAQKNIFNNDEEKFEQIYSFHNQLIEILGAENIYQAELTEDRRPEKSWKKKFDAPHSISDAPKATDYIPDRPTYLCIRPLKVEVTAGFIYFGTRRKRILYWDPLPEKIKGGWFENVTSDIKDVFDRLYYNVDIEGHQRLLIFETTSKEYFLHGYYG